jgi:hypothetical protein
MSSPETSATPAPTSTAPPPATAPAAAPPPRPGLSSSAKAGIGVGVAVVLVAVVVLAGVIPGVHPLSSSGGSGGSTAGTSATAFPLANSYATAHGAGVLYGVFGISVTSAFSATLGNESGSCPVHQAVNFTVPSDSASYSKGSASGWIFVYWSAGNSTVDVIGVLGSQARLLASYVGPACDGALPFLAPLPASYLNSTSAATLVDTIGAGVPAFLAAHGSANAEYTLMATNSSQAPPVWAVYYTTCGIGPGTHTGVGSAMSAFVSAALLTVAPLSAAEAAGQSCSGGANPIPGLGQTWYMGFAHVANGSDGAGFYDTVTASSSPGLNTSDVGLEVLNATTGTAAPTTAVPGTCVIGVTANVTTCGAPAAPGWYAVLFNQTSSVIVATYGDANAAWTTGIQPAVAVNANDDLVIISTANLHSHGYLLSPFGNVAGLVVGSVSI